MKALIIILLVASAGGGAWWYFGHSHADPVQYQTTAVAKGDLTQTVTATGTLNPVVNVQVGSQISGNIFKLYADFNSTVKAGDIVAEIDPSVYQAIVHQSEGDLASAQAALELAKLTATRKKELVDQRAAPQADLDTATANLRQAEATVKIKSANLEKSKADLDHCKVYSPIDGTVISRAVDVGQTVAASMNAPVLFTVAQDLTEMQIDTNVAEADVGVVEENQDVDFTVDAFPYRTFHGKVKQVRNAATTVQNVVTYDVVVAVKNDDRKLKPGMTAIISVFVAHRDDTVKVSNGALRYRPPEADPKPAMTGMNGGPGVSPSPDANRPKGGGGKGKGGKPRTERPVYVLRPGAAKPELVQVKVGITDGISTEVLEGLKEGDLAVIGQTGGAGASQGPANTNPLSGGMRFR